MHGKKILAATSALLGYDDIQHDSYFLRYAKGEFIAAVQFCYYAKRTTFDETVRRTNKQGNATEGETANAARAQRA